MVGDVCGRGIEAAALMTQIRCVVNALVSLQSDQLDRAFDRAEQLLNLTGNEFVATLSVHVIDAAANTISYVSAGHPPALLIDKSGREALLKGGRRRVLGMGGPVPKMGRVDFAPGSILVASTDGLVEHDRDLDNGTQLRDCVVAAPDGTAREISNAVASTIPIHAPKTSPTP